MLRELAELGMELARAAAQQALAACKPTQADAAPSAAGHGPSESPRPDPGLTFARLSRAVRQAIALEARIAAGDLGPAPRWPARRPQADPRLRVVRRLLHEAAAEAATDATGREALLRDIDERLDDLPATDPDGDLPIDEIIETICTDLGLCLDPSGLPNDVLDAITRGRALRLAPTPGAGPCLHASAGRPGGPDPPAHGSG